MDEAYRAKLETAGDIDALFEALLDSGTALEAGVNSLGYTRRAVVREVRESRIELAVSNIPYGSGPTISFSFQARGYAYRFEAQVLSWPSLRIVEIARPESIQPVERRYAQRHAGGAMSAAEIEGGEQRWFPVEVVDSTHSGMAIDAPSGVAEKVSDLVQVRADRPGEAPFRFFGRVRHRAPSATRKGWTRIGLSRTSSRWQNDAGLEIIERVSAATSAVEDSIEVRGSESPPFELVEYRNAAGERIRAILDSADGSSNAPMVIIPPAWGRTKETLIVLARTITETFRSARLPVNVLRFDGVRRRGESHADPDCVDVSKEHLHFTVSQAVDDIVATLDFVESEHRLKTDRVVLVTSSVAAVEGRRAIVGGAGARLSGWISLVGVADLQSALRMFSGGVDFGEQWQSGVHLGDQELLGVRCNMDRLARDAIEGGHWWRADAERDFETIHTPITWIRGTHDAWTSREYVEEVLSLGESHNRRLVEIPYGHHLRDGDGATLAFGVVAEEAARMLVGRDLVARAPNTESLRAQAAEERARLPIPGVDLSRFWSDYLVGRRGELGIELLAQTSAYRQLMARQVARMQVSECDSILDLGAGVGEMPMELARMGASAESVQMVDFSRAGLTRALCRLRQVGAGVRFSYSAVMADLDLKGEALSIPAADETFDVVLASLLLSYVSDPAALIRESFRVLKPGGSIVVSSVRRDADLSRIYVDSLEELEVAAASGSSGLAEKARRARQDFLNDASRIIDFEEFGVFQFFEAEDLSEMLWSAGFRHLTSEYSFGSPPQATIASGTR